MLPYFADELKLKHVTRRLLWEEYISSNPDGYRYTQFCYHLQRYLMSKKGSVILDHLPCGELYVNFAGETLEYFDRSTNTAKKVKVFIGCMPYSSYTFVMGVKREKTIRTATPKVWKAVYYKQLICFRRLQATQSR
ncbi:MAG: hypothetical protein LBQ31_07000 [Bacteroidales bacterium]|nr:hypothetical protein [Bacteroidales bacterium]